MRLTMRMIPISLLLVLLSVALVGCGGDAEEEAPATAAAPPPPAPAAPAPVPAAIAPAPGPASEVVEVVNRDVAGSGEYKFDPPELNFTLGETVTLRVNGEAEFHTFTVDELGIDESFDAGETVEFTFTFDKAGTFKLYCIPHEALGMVGTITVK